MRGSRSRFEGDLVRPHVANIVSAVGLMWQRARNLRRDILNECPAERDIQNLWSATDCENGFSGLARGEHKRYLSLITLPVHRA